MATPVEWRTFVSVVPEAKKRMLGPIFFSQNIRVIYKLSAITGQKTDKNPPKKGVFPAPPTSFFWRVVAHFLSGFLLFHGQFVYEMQFLHTKIGPVDLL